MKSCIWCLKIIHKSGQFKCLMTHDKFFHLYVFFVGHKFLTWVAIMEICLLQWLPNLENHFTTLPCLMDINGSLNGL